MKTLHGLKDFLTVIMPTYEMGQFLSVVSHIISIEGEKSMQLEERGGKNIDRRQPR